MTKGINLLRRRLVEQSDHDYLTEVLEAMHLSTSAEEMRDDVH